MTTDNLSAGQQTLNDFWLTHDTISNREMSVVAYAFRELADLGLGAVISDALLKRAIDINRRSLLRDEAARRDGVEDTAQRPFSAEERHAMLNGLVAPLPTPAPPADERAELVAKLRALYPANTSPLAAATLLERDGARIAELERERDGERAEKVARGKMLVRLRNKFIVIRDELDDQGDLVAFGSTNHADDFRDVVEHLDQFKWDLVLAEKSEPDLIERCRAATARAEAAEARLKRILDLRIPTQHECITLNGAERAELAFKAAQEIASEMDAALAQKEPGHG